MTNAVTLPVPSIDNLESVVNKGNYLYYMMVANDYDPDKINAFSDAEDGARIYDHTFTAFTDMSADMVTKDITRRFGEFGVVNVSVDEHEFGDGYSKVTVYTTDYLIGDDSESFEFFDYMTM